jgi:Fe-S cluster assembly protein SufB
MTTEQDYKYGFTTDIETESIPKGLSEETVRLISAKKNEPAFMLEFRLKAFQRWKEMTPPVWANVNFPAIDYQDMCYYSAPKKKQLLSSLDEVDPQLLKTFERLGIPVDEQKRLTNVAIDVVFDSVSLGTTFQNELKKAGVVLCSMSEAVELYPRTCRKIFRKRCPDRR